MQVSALWTYPVKATAGLPAESMVIERSGPQHDRRWMVVDPDGKPLSARFARRLLLVRAEPESEGALRLSAPGLASLGVRPPITGERVRVSLSRLNDALDGGDEAAGWFSALLGRTVRLVWLEDLGRRTVSVRHGGQPADRMTLADAGPVLLTSTTSLARLDEWVTATMAQHGGSVPLPLDMRRFRPNVVVDGVSKAFAEDHWKRLRVGEVEMRFAEHCDRCVVTTIDPDTLAGGVEPIRTLAGRRRWDGRVYFGVRMVPTVPGRVAVGDPVTPL